MMKGRIFKHVCDIFIVLVLFLMTNSCKKESLKVPSNLKGTEGELRFYLTYTPGDTLDLDLHVRTPNGDVINYTNTHSSSGTYEQDCRCASCTEGSWENVYWTKLKDKSTYTPGTYHAWVNAYNFCKNEGGIADFTLYCIKDGKVLMKESGSLGFKQTTNQYSVKID